MYQVKPLCESEVRPVLLFKSQVLRTLPRGTSYLVIPLQGATYQCRHFVTSTLFCPCSESGYVHYKEVIVQLVFISRFVVRLRAVRRSCISYFYKQTLISHVL